VPNASGVNETVLVAGTGHDQANPEWFGIMLTLLLVPYMFASVVLWHHTVNYMHAAVKGHRHGSGGVRRHRKLSRINQCLLLILFIFFGVVLVVLYDVCVVFFPVLKIVFRYCGCCRMSAARFADFLNYYTRQRDLAVGLLEDIPLALFKPGCSCTWGFWTHSRLSSSPWWWVYCTHLWLSH